MKRFIIILLACISLGTLNAQNEYEIRKSIESSLENFMSRITFLNDDEEPIQASTIASDFGGGHYFRVNGSETNLESFLKSYSSSDLRQMYVNHSLNFTTKSISKTSSNSSDKRWTIKAKLSRENATNEDYLIKDEDITFVVRWNGIDKEVSILEISFSTPLQIVRPVTNREYRFEIDRKNSTLSLTHTGGDWKLSLLSKYRDVKSYPGIEGKTIIGNYYPSPYTYNSPNNLKVTVNDDPQYLSGNLRGNYSKQPRYYSIKLIQTDTGKTIDETITVNPPKETTPWDYDFEGNQIELFYSLKYNFGLSYMYSFGNSRFSIGLLAAMNFDKFRGMKNSFTTEEVHTIIGGSGSNTITGSNTVNGYNITKETVNPEKTNYSSLLDPYNEAKHYTSRSLYLVQGGFNVSQWARFDLGLGAARARDLYFMENAYALDIYKYEKTSSALPDIDDVYVYRNKYKDYYFKDPAKWGFAIRPALNFNIPLNSYNDSFLSLGVGYTFVTGIKDANSLDFSIGFRFGD